MRIISRVFSDPQHAKKANDWLTFKAIPKGARAVITAGDNVEAALEAAGVHSSAIAPYAAAIAKGGAALVVKTTFKPLGAAKIVREALSRRADQIVAFGSEVDQDHAIAWEPDHAPSVLKDHPHFMTLPGIEISGNISSAFGVPTVSGQNRRKKVMDGSKRMSKMFWPMPLLSSKSRANKTMDGSRRMSRAFWPMPLVTSGERRKSVIEGGGAVLSSRMGWKTLS